MYLFLSLLQKRPRTQGGFSLLELLVAIAIFVILSGTFLLNYNNFNKRIMIDTLAHQIGQWMRDAQVSAMSVKRAKTQAGTFPAYGLHFDLATPSKFIYFADLNGDKQYAPLGAGQKCGDPSVECEREITLLKGNTITALCGDAPSGSSSSALCGSYDASNKFDISFTRPNPDALIYGDLAGAGFPTSYARARITVSSVKGYTRTVELWTTGQITVQ